MASLAQKINTIQEFETHVIQLIIISWLFCNLELLVPEEREENMYQSAETSPMLPIQRIWCGSNIIFQSKYLKDKPKLMKG